MTGSGVESSSVAVIVAGGTGERFGRHGGKQLLRIGGQTVLALAVRAAASAVSTAAVVVACHPDRVDEYRREMSNADLPHKPFEFVEGGASRQESMARGLDAAERFGRPLVAVHDGARPLATPELFDEACATLLCEAELDGVVIGHPVTDTLKLASGARIESTADRSRFWAVQTPQVFRTSVLRRALDAALSTGFTGTDDASLVERIGGRVGLVQGPRTNLKITLPEDAAVAEAILDWRERSES